jgi:hypothetical protein
MTFHRVAFAGVVVALGSLAAAAEDSAPPGNAALLAFAREPLTFDPFVFTGPTFPACNSATRSGLERVDRTARRPGSSSGFALAIELTMSLRSVFTCRMNITPVSSAARDWGRYWERPASGSLPPVAIPAPLRAE